jgi:hypothetical protein
MNERIRQLYYQCQDESQRTESCYQMFAELIVKECEQVSLKNSHRSDDMGAIIAEHIKQHFGVE